MKKIKIKFYLSLIFLLIYIIVTLFFRENINMLEKILVPIFFIYFVLDALSVLFPAFNKSINSGKYLNKFYIQTNNYNKDLLSQHIKKQNKSSLLIFLLYFGILTIIGFFIITSDSIENEYIYLLFFFINFADYFCILVWCPFKSLILKNACCNRCRIANWDRLMKFYILIFIPSIYSIILVILGVIIFFIWEYKHHSHPERFYFVSNGTLSCNMCQYHIGCIKKKE